MMMSKSTMMSKPRAAVRTNATKRFGGKGASGDYGWYPEFGTYIGSGAVCTSSCYFVGTHLVFAFHSQANPHK